MQATTKNIWSKITKKTKSNICVNQTTQDWS